MNSQTPLLDKAVLLQKSPVALPNGFDPTTGLTTTGEGLKGPRQCFRSLLQKQVEQEATSGRVKWPSRSARRAWVRDETKRRYLVITAPST
jgi:hypothetical protein